MSEQGWQAFLAAEGVDDWVVLHGGATAVFRVASLGEAARLAEAVAEVPGLEGAGVLLTIADGRLTRAADPRHLVGWRSGTSSWRGRSRRSRGRTARRRPRSRPGGPARDRGEARRDRRRLLASRARLRRRWPTTTPSTRSATARRSGCRSSTRPSRCGTRCTSTCRSRASTSRRGWRRRSPRAAASSTTPRRPGTGPSPTRRQPRVSHRVARRAA